jgi:hypothetical protein
MYVCMYIYIYICVCVCVCVSTQACQAGDIVLVNVAMTMTVALTDSGIYNMDVCAANEDTVARIS